MKTYPVIIFTDAETSKVHVFQVDDISLNVDVQEPSVWVRSMPLDRWYTISAKSVREVVVEDHDQAFAALARAMSQEIDRLHQHARDEYKRGLTNGERNAFDRIRGILAPDDGETECTD